MARLEADAVHDDPNDVAIDADPYPVFRRLREEAPLHYNFSAVSRFDDVERELVDRETYPSGRGAILELIEANIETPCAAGRRCRFLNLHLAEVRQPLSAQGPANSTSSRTARNHDARKRSSAVGSTFSRNQSMRARSPSTSSK